MALSNIFVEPKREITESVVGIGIVLIPCIAWYLISNYLARITWNPVHIEHGQLDVCPYPLWVVMYIVAVAIAAFAVWALSAGFLIFTHFIGDEICNSLQRRNINLRPIERYKRNYKGEIVKTN